MFIVFNLCGALFFYWLTRVPKGKKEAKEDKKTPKKEAATTTVA